MFDIDREHPHYVLRKQVWRRYRDLYIGGEQLRFNAQHYLVRRQREPGDVYAERLSRVFYENYIGSIVDWYAATLFADGAGADVSRGERAARISSRSSWTMWIGRARSWPISGERQFVETLIAGASYVLVDFPRVGAERRGLGRKRMRWELRGLTWWIIRPRTSSTGTSTSRGISSGWCCGRGDLKKIGWKTRSGGRRRGGLLRQAEFPDLREESTRRSGRFGWWTKGRMGWRN